jgi:hypothetical protein
MDEQTAEQDWQQEVLLAERAPEAFLEDFIRDVKRIITQRKYVRFTVLQAVLRQPEGFLWRELHKGIDVLTRETVDVEYIWLANRFYFIHDGGEVSYVGGIDGDMRWQLHPQVRILCADWIKQRSHKPRATRGSSPIVATEGETP